jgi:hypothetical protein
MTSQLHNAKLGLMLPAILNPATTAVVGIGLGLLWLLRDDEQDATDDDEPIKLPSSAVTAVVKPVRAVDPRPCELTLEGDDAEIVPMSKANQKEAIRSAMSELGKPSAMARAKKSRTGRRGGVTERLAASRSILWVASGPFRTLTGHRMPRRCFPEADINWSSNFPSISGSLCAVARAAHCMLTRP